MSGLAPVSARHQECYSTWDLQEKIYMVQPPSYVVPRKKRLVYRLKKALYSLINGNDSTGIANFKTHLGKQYHNKDLGFLCYFIGIEVARSEEGIRLCQRK
jgi:hypothetical protein